ncbi:MAG: hypothetical protein AB7G05_13665 [Hyphomonadaceae bacterium]
MSDEPSADDEWDEETVIDLRRTALEQAMVAHLHKREAAPDIGEVFKLADRFVNYMLGDQNP